MLAEVIYDEYREWFSSFDDNGYTLPAWRDLPEIDKKQWRKVAAAAEQHVKTEISSSW
jgi:hypothetical protein